jgi:hypothetical protein
MTPRCGPRNTTDTDHTTEGMTMKDDAPTTLADSPRPAPDTMPEGRAEVPPIPVQLSGGEANEHNVFTAEQVRDGISIGDDREPIGPALNPEGTTQTTAIPAPGRLARFRAMCRRNAFATAIFTLIVVFSVEGLFIFKDSDLLTWTGVGGFAVSILARNWLHKSDTDNAVILKLLGDLCAVSLLAATVRDTFAAHPVIQWVAYGLTAIFGLIAAKVFARELTDSKKG